MGKLDINTPSFIIESDATIVAPLMFAYILDDQISPMIDAKESSSSKKKLTTV